ncbi:YihY/virulence factor BrkB family protein [Stutzerimonas tarimensis]|uniref:YihY/virulence factor BrkB family protein n=1 Tax=Stutzerimonas tarimensis TaxID=1507735 RepID=A0ABV7T8L0_9GAMM
MALLDTGGTGLVELTKRTVKRFGEKEMTIYASALAFHTLFSLFPFLLFLVALLGFLHLGEFFEWIRLQAELALPPMAMEQVNPVIDQLQEQQGGLLSFGILLALISASKGVRTLMAGMNAAYDVHEQRPGWKIYLLSLVYTVGIAGMLLVAAALMIMGPQVMEWLASLVGLQDIIVTLWTWLRWPVVVILMMLAVAVMYYVAPDVEQSFRFITPGSVLAVLVWIVASIGFGIYVQNFANFNATYGSIGAIIVLLMYFFLSASVLLFGAVLNSVIEHSSSQGKDDGDKKLDS